MLSTGVAGYRQLDGILYACTIRKIHETNLDIVYMDDGKLETIPARDFIWKQEALPNVIEPLTFVLEFLTSVEKINTLSVSQQWKSMVFRAKAWKSLSFQHVRMDTLVQLIHMCVKQHTLAIPIKYLIESITFQRSNVTNEMLEYLIRHCPKLKQLICLECDQVYCIVPDIFKAGKNIEYMDFWKCSKVSFTHVRELQQLRPLCNIRSSGMIPIAVSEDTKLEFKLVHLINIIPKAPIIQDLLTKKNKSDFYNHERLISKQEELIIVRSSEDCFYLYDSLDAMKREYATDPQKYYKLQEAIASAEERAACFMAPTIDEVFDLDKTAQAIIMRLDAQRTALAEQIQQLHARMGH